MTTGSTPPGTDLPGPGGDPSPLAPSAGAEPAWDAVLTPLTPQDPLEISGYLLRARIGEGGMGAVYLSYTPGGRPVALKIARPEFAADPAFRRRFATEVAIAQRVQGLYTAPVIDCDANAARPWLATAYVAAPSLAAVVARQGPLPAETVLVLIAGVAEALQSIHAAGVIHRDLKPGNVILAADGPRVIDFGISRAVEASSAAITQTGVRIGTPAFMSPEQVRGKPLAAAGDVFSLGSTAYYAIIGELPFGADAAVFHRIEHQQPDWERCPEQVRGVLEQCVAKDPAARPTPAALIELCRAASTDERLRIGEGWLPATVTAEITRYSITPPSAHPPSAHPPSPPHPYPPQPARPGTPRPGVAPSPSAPPAPTPPDRPRRNRTPWLIGGLSAAAALVVAIVLLTALNNTPSGQPNRGGAATGSGAGNTSTGSETSTTGSGLSSSSTPSAGSPSSAPSSPDSPTAIVLAQERLRMTDSGDGVDVDALPLTVNFGGLGGSFYTYAGRISGNRLALWSAAGVPTADGCASQLRTQPMSAIDIHTGLRFCATGRSSRRIAAGEVVSYGNGVSQIQVTIWDIQFNG
ncbi:serine/threonine-protein kinase [Frankia sp. CIT1]|uniref:serine/threonine-protein kinase n=1 Tax=Frankia sp. CIT1 TaxID=2880974 RepID=UPI001EF60EFB|nr:serine/threonine-protein kinase [Frankia sp. CIT1]